jgi:hypothetical protein
MSSLIYLSITELKPDFPDDQDLPDVNLSVVSEDLNDLRLKRLSRLILTRTYSGIR